MISGDVLERHAVAHERGSLAKEAQHGDDLTSRPRSTLTPPQSPTLNLVRAISFGA
jgi:hypothetical protein